MREFASILQVAGFLVYALPIIVCATMMLKSKAATPPIQLVRRFQQLGPIMGIALGACIFGSLLGVWMDRGEFELGLANQRDRLDTAIAISFFAVWVSNIKLEIWTLDPVRKSDPAPSGSPSDMAAYKTAVAAFRRHIILHALGVLSVALLSFAR